MKVAIEPYISGNYIKFSSNTGYENPDFDAFIPAFSHYTWIRSKGIRVVLDAQGVFKDGKYYLTDPACQSLDQKFGNSDLGAMGLCKFLLCHKHNDILIICFSNSSVIEFILLLKSAISTLFSKL